MRLKINPNGGHFVDLVENISPSKTDIKNYNKLSYIVCESLSNETIKIFVAISQGWVVAK